MNQRHIRHHLNQIQLTYKSHLSDSNKQKRLKEAQQPRTGVTTRSRKKKPKIPSGLYLRLIMFFPFLDLPVKAPSGENKQHTYKRT